MYLNEILIGVEVSVIKCLNPGQPILEREKRKTLGLEHRISTRMKIDSTRLEESFFSSST